MDRPANEEVHDETTITGTGSGRCADVLGTNRRPEFKPAPEVPAMPKALMKLPRTDITRAKFPAVDFHFHGRSLRTAADYQKMIG